jgi:hypothetical protein
MPNTKLQIEKEKLEKEINANVLIPEDTWDSLMAAIDGRDWTAVINISNTCRELAEDQKPQRFKTHRHGVK